MLEYGLKDATKDIDLVCKDKEDKARPLEAARNFGFRIVGPEKRHARLGLDRAAVKGRHTLDIFGCRISYDFGLYRGRTARKEVLRRRVATLRAFTPPPYHHYPATGSR